MSGMPSWLSDDNDKSGGVATSDSADDWSQPPPVVVPQSSTKSLEMDRGNDDASTVVPKKTWNEYWGDSFRRDGGLIFVAICICVLSNIPYGQYVVYPFTIFSTWIHETCQG